MYRSVIQCSFVSAGAAFGDGASGTILADSS